jgi:hypothetical protein
MEDLQSYLFKNSQDIPKNHIINITNLYFKYIKMTNNLLKVHRDKYIKWTNGLLKIYKERSPRVILYETDYINIFRRECGITSEKMIITERFYNDNLKDILGAFNEFFYDDNLRDILGEYNELFVTKLKSLLIDWKPTHFIFPKYVNKSDRQLIHIMSNMGKLFKSKTTEYTSKDVGVLNIFIP